MLSKAQEDAVLSSLAEAFGVARSSLPAATGGVAARWAAGAGAVQDAGWHLGDLEATLRRPSPRHAVYVAGADVAWGPGTAYTDGALDTARAVVERYFLDQDTDSHLNYRKDVNNHTEL